MVMQNYKTNCFNSDNFSIKCGDKLINFKNPVVMGILNLTPDSFYDGGSYLDKTSILKRAEQIILEGATIVDLGAYSTRPGAAIVTEEEELKRMLPAVEIISKEFPKAILSIDTFRSGLAKKVVTDFGPCIINDISGGTMDADMFALVGELKIPYILMHIQGQPQNMQKNPVYTDVVEEMLSFFRTRIQKLNDFGATDLILDPGFGFGKTLDHNYEILAKLQDFNQFHLPILAGISRKSMIYKLLGGDPSSSLNGTTALHMSALQNGAVILRAHDVKEALECVQLYTKIKSVKK
jgi:dihydropteroate synthase